MIEYQVVLNKRRKKMAIKITPLGDIIVEIGKKTDKKIINNFVVLNEEWIIKSKQEIAKKQIISINLTEQQKREMRYQATVYMTNLTKKYSQIMQLTPQKIKITSAKKRWGSCSYNNSICYSLYAMALPEKLREYIVVHELCHISQKNHSLNFYSLLEKYLPDYKQTEKEFKKYIVI